MAELAAKQAAFEEVAKIEADKRLEARRQAVRERIEREKEALNKVGSSYGLYAVLRYAVMCYAMLCYDLCYVMPCSTRDYQSLINPISRFQK